MKTVLITGCSAGGIGSSLVETFHARGFHVFATSRRTATMTHLSSLPNLTLLALDVTSDADIAAAVTAVQQSSATAARGGGLDYLVNNAGVYQVMPVLDLNMNDARGLFETNFWGPLALTRAFMPLLMAGSEGGTVVNVGSISSVLSVPFIAIYAASKAALEAASETMRLELAPLGVKIVTLNAGSVDSRVQLNLGDVRLPENSLYRPIETDLLKRVHREDDLAQMETNVFAKQVVEDVLAGKTGRIWRGRHATMVRIVSSFMPAWVVDYLVSAGTGLSDLAKLRSLSKND